MPEAAPSSAPPRPQVPLDEVMLAMDVVDTLRHQRAQVAAELDEDQRQAQLVARVRSIYESQGMDVPAEVIEQGVQALVEDRFVYRPPERSLAVRFAEIYVERGKWLWRLFLVALVVVAVWLCFYIPARIDEARQIDRYEQGIEDLQSRVQRLRQRGQSLRRRLAAIDAPELENKASQLLKQAADRLGRNEKGLADLKRRIDANPDAAGYLADRAGVDSRIEGQGGVLEQLEGEQVLVRKRSEEALDLITLRVRCVRALSGLQGVPIAEDEREDLEARRSSLLGLVDAGETTAAQRGLRSLRAEVAAILKARADRQDKLRELERLRARIKGLGLSSALRRDLESIAAAAAAGITAEDDVEASKQLGRLSAEVAVLAQSYQLRIVTGRGRRSGVWRNTPGRQRNHYLIVQAVDERGRVLRLRIRNEENNRIERVRSFGIRVSKATYDKVKQDKIDNGIIDNRLVGRKVRGQRDVVYTMPVTGGRITRW